MQRMQPPLSRLLPESREASVALASATGLALLLGYLLFVTPAQQERALVRRARTLSPPSAAVTSKRCLCVARTVWVRRRRKRWRARR